MKITMFLSILLSIPVSGYAYSSGPPNGKTGAPGEQTCWNSCHSSFPLNSGDGSLTISGPANFLPGQSYTISVEISDPGQSRWGFEITPLNIGSVALTDFTRTQLSLSGDMVYVKQTTTGSDSGTPNGPVTWSFDWTAPNNPPSQVTFYAAGNAANNNGSNLGDYIYTTTFTSNLIVTGIDDDFSGAFPSHISVNNYPNPFNAATTISFNLPVAGNIILNIYNINGQIVKTLIDGYYSAGEYNVKWNAVDAPSGLYFYRLTAGVKAVTGKMTLMK